MKKIHVTLDVDENVVLAESGQECLSDAVSQELGWLHDSGMFVESWSFAEKEKVHNDVKTEAFAIFERLVEMQNSPEYLIAKDMAFLQNEAEPDEPLTDEQAYVLASKFEEARGSWFTTTVNHSEYLEALKDLLECGVYEGNVPEFPKLSPRDTLKLLMTADEQVFGTLVEAAAVQNAYRYLPYDYKLGEEDLVAVKKAADSVLDGTYEPVDSKLAEAYAKVFSDVSFIEEKEKDEGPEL